MKCNSSVFFQLKPLYFRQKSIFRLLNGWVKITKFRMSCLKLQVSFSLNFSVMRDHSSVHFLIETVRDLDKKVHQSAKFLTV